MKVIRLQEFARRPRRAGRKVAHEALMIVEGRRFNPERFDDELDIDRVLEHHPAFRYTVHE